MHLYADDCSYPYAVGHFVKLIEIPNAIRSCILSAYAFQYHTGPIIPSNRALPTLAPSHPTQQLEGAPHTGEGFEVERELFEGDPPPKRSSDHLHFRPRATDSARANNTRHS